MAQKITLTLDLTPETLEILKLLTTAPAIQSQAIPSEVAVEKDKRQTKKSTAKDKKTTTLKNDSGETKNATSTITLTDVRAVALTLAKAGKQKQLKDIFAKYGGEKLSDVPESKYKDLLVDLEDASAT